MRRQFKVFVTARAFLPDQPPYHSPATRPAPSRLASALALSIAISATFLTVAGPASAAPTAFLAQFSAPGTFFASTVPANGDENPYGIVNVPRSIGKLVRGDTLVSNFNDGSNAQGTGTTIVQIPPTGSPNPSHKPSHKSTPPTFLAIVLEE